MTKAEVDDIFGEFEIDEDYMIKTKDVIGLFVAVKEEPKVEEPAPVEEAPEAEPHERVRARRPAGRDLRTLHLRQHGQDVPGEDGRRQEEEEEEEGRQVN